MSLYFGVLPKFSQQRKEDHVYYDPKTSRMLMQFDIHGMSEFFAAPRPLYRQVVEKQCIDHYKSRLTYLRTSWLQIDTLVEEMEHCRNLMTKYDYIDPHEYEEDCTCEGFASSKPPMPYWLLLRERALTQIGCGYTTYQISLELEQAMMDQMYQEKIVDYTTDNMQQEIAMLKQEVLNLKAKLEKKDIFSLHLSGEIEDNSLFSSAHTPLQ